MTSALTALILNRKGGAPSETQEEEQVFEQELPDEAQWLFHSQLQKKAVKVAGGCFVWLERQCVLTPTSLLLTKPGTTRILDWICMAEITKIQCVQGVKTTQNKSSSMRRRDTISNIASPNNLFDQLDPQDEHLSFVVHTSEDGPQAGKLFCLKADTAELCDEWVHQLRSGWQNAIHAAHRKVPVVERLRNFARLVWKSRLVAMLRFLIIFAAFTVSVFAEEFRDKAHTKIIHNLQLSFTCVFSAELLVNVFANWRDEFLEDKWNWFDTAIVVLSILSECVDDAPTVQVIRLLRSLRVIRLLRLFRSLNNIAQALADSVWPVLNTFFVLFLVSCIYAVIATELYSDKSEEFFGSFSKSLFSMFQVSTGDSWASGIARTLRRDDGELDAWAMLFLVSNVLVVGLVLINVVVAVLLDSFLSSVARDKDLQTAHKAKKIGDQMGIVRSPLEPLLESMQGFYTNDDLSARIQDLFQVLDSDESLALSFDELRSGLRKLPLADPITLTPDDFEMMTEGFALCNAGRELDGVRFERVMRAQLRQHVQMQAQTLAVSAQPIDRTLLSLLKQLMIASEGVSGQRGYGVANLKPGMYAHREINHKKPPFPYSLYQKCRFLHWISRCATGSGPGPGPHCQ